MESPRLVPAVFTGWHAYQNAIAAALQPLAEAQLALRAAPWLRSVGQIASHMIGARARWFYLVMGEGRSEPKVITRQWVIWYLIEHDLHHGGEISLALGIHSIRGVAL